MHKKYNSIIATFMYSQKEKTDFEVYGYFCLSRRLRKQPAVCCREEFDSHEYLLLDRENKRMVRKELHTSALLTLPAFESHVCTQGSGCLLIVYPVFSVCRCRSRISYLRKEKSCTPKRIYPHRRYRKSSGRGQKEPRK